MYSKVIGCGEMKVYLSSTFKDLAEHRRSAYDAMRSLGLDVVAMEDYVARDERPVGSCLADVASSDLYVGVLAFRYGYIPEHDNPDRHSITELEYRQAVRRDIPRLMFLARNDTWDISQVDAVTGEGDRGEQIKRLRDEVGRDAVVGWFTTPSQLALEVTKSISVWLFKHDAVPAVPRTAPSAVPHPRQLEFDVLLLHGTADRDSAAAIASALSGIWDVHVSGTGLTAASADDLRALDRLAASSRSVAVLLSPSSLTTLQEDRARSSRVLGLARERTGVLLGLAIEDVPGDVGIAWEMTEVLTPAALRDRNDAAGLAGLLHHALAKHVSKPDDLEIGLPVVIVAMTAAEAADLFSKPPAAMAELLRHAEGAGRWGLDRYGDSRSQWRPFGSADTVEQVLDAAVSAVNAGGNRAHNQIIRLQRYPLEPLMRDGLLMWPVYRSIARSGCLVVVDELSLFHEEIRRAFEESPIPDGEQVALVTLSAWDPMADTPYARAREQLNGYLAAAAKRFSVGLDPLCELGIPERHRLDRWLHVSLPSTMDMLKHAKRDDAKLRRFEEELGTRPNPAMSRLIAGEHVG
jgi:hypothetical protein